MKSKQEWMNDLIKGQDNIDPIRRIPNGALLQGSLIKGTLRLNPVQRIGALILGSMSLALGCFALARLVEAVRSWNFSGPMLLVVFFSPFSLWFGWKILLNAVINNPKRDSTRS